MKLTAGFLLPTVAVTVTSPDGTNINNVQTFVLTNPTLIVVQAMGGPQVEKPPQGEWDVQLSYTAAGGANITSGSFFRLLLQTCGD